jgi:hypothetical protein
MERFRIRVCATDELGGPAGRMHRTVLSGWLDTRPIVLPRYIRWSPSAGDMVDGPGMTFSPWH